MILYSFTFLVLFSIIYFVFWKFPKHHRWIILLLFSYYFYAATQPAYLAIILITTFVSYYCAILMQRNKQQKTLWLVLALIFTLGLLLLFKYFNFFAFSLENILRTSLPHFNLLLPLGISFYTLQVLGYLTDVYKGTVKPEKNFGVYALFVCFFPQLSAGPIERSTTLLPQLKKPLIFQYEQVAEGSKLFLFGLFKKIVIADNLAIVVDRAFSSLPEYKGISLIIVMFLFTWQIYMDFSGYTDMARGLAKMVGINLLENFHTPYAARSIQDFWRRWHISLSTWLRDYVYFPLGGSKNGLVRTILNTNIVFLVSGLWHGAAWSFVLWGLLHGMSISFERILKKYFHNFTIPVAIQIAYAYTLVTIFWIFFRSPTIQDALYILRNALVGVRHFLSFDYLMASLNQLFVFNQFEMVLTACLVSFAIFIEVLQNRISIMQLISKQPLFIRFAIYSFFLLLILQLRNAEIKEFIYVRF